MYRVTYCDTIDIAMCTSVHIVMCITVLVCIMKLNLFLMIQLRF